MKKRRNIAVTAVIAGIFLSIPNGYCGLVIVEFSAEVSDVVDSYGFMQGIVNIGDTITGTYTYDTSAPDSSPLLGIGRYEYYAPPSGIFIHVAGFESRTDPENTDFVVTTENDAYLINGTRDSFRLESNKNLPFGSDTIIDMISLYLGVHNGNALSSDALPTVAPVVADWQLLRVYVGGYVPHIAIRPKGFYFIGDITSAHLIPEPATMMLLGLGGAALLKNLSFIKGQLK